jgi:hypothetical protein
MSATDEMLRDSNRRLSIDAYQIGWLRQTIKHAEEKLSRLDDIKDRKVLNVIIADIISELRAGRESAEEQAEKNAA